MYADADQVHFLDQQDYNQYALMRSDIDREMGVVTENLQGILALMEQPPVAAQPPGWVSAEVVGYSHFSLDLGKMYSQIQAMIIREWGPQAHQWFAMIEGAVMAYAQADFEAKP